MTTPAWAGRIGGIVGGGAFAGNATAMLADTQKMPHRGKPRFAFAV